MLKTIGVSLLIALLTIAPAGAFLGFGDIVFDPTNFEEAVQQLAQLARQYEQLRQTYEMIQNQYEQMKWMAQQDPVNMLARYRAVETPWIPSWATNIYGTSAAWTASINSGINASTAYASSVEPLGTYGASFDNIPGDQAGRIKTSYASVELADGANVAALQTLGALRTNAAQANAAIKDLEDDSLSSVPEMNTEIAVLNKINAATIIALRNGQDTNKVLVALTEEQILQAKRERDAAARAFNQHIGFMTNARPLMSAQSAGASEAMLAWRMP